VYQIEALVFVNAGYVIGIYQLCISSYPVSLS